jgi:hypothetical protein
VTHQKPTESDVRRDLDLDLADLDEAPASDSEWRSLKDQHRIGDVLAAADEGERDDAMSTLVTAVTAIRSDRRLQRKPSLEAPVTYRRVPNDQRSIALGQILALEAAELPGVASYRSTHLGGTTLTPETAFRWVSLQAGPAPRRTWWAEVPVDADGRPAPGFEAPVHHQRWLRYGNPPSEGSAAVNWNETSPVDYSHTVPVPQSGALLDLADTASLLIERYSWPEEWAVQFILTGAAPPPPPVVRITSQFSRRRPWPSVVRLNMETAAQVGVAQLRQEYAEVRRRVLVFFGRHRIRDIDEKTAQLAVFWYEHRKLTAEQRRQKWNRDHPNWPYRNARGNFARHARDAFENVTWRSLPAGSTEPGPLGKGTAESRRNRHGQH